jgi:hypothetical protein
MFKEALRVVAGESSGTKDYPWQAVVRYDEFVTVAELAREVGENDLRLLDFAGPEFFADCDRGMELCAGMRELDINVLWVAHMECVPKAELLRAMRLAGCQRIEFRLGPADASEALLLARGFGFDIRLSRLDGGSYVTDRISYTVAEREAVAELLPGLHAAQFDLAVAYYRARRFGDVMQPLGKAMILRFPMNELCLNLLACLSAAKHYPDMAAGLLDQAGHGCPHPVVFRNRGLLLSWMESGGDLRGVRLDLESVGSHDIAP